MELIDKQTAVSELESYGEFIAQKIVDGIPPVTLSPCSVCIYSPPRPCTVCEDCPAKGRNE